MAAKTASIDKNVEITSQPIYAIADVIGAAFQSLFQQECTRPDVAYVPPVIVSAQSRLRQTGSPTIDDRKAAKSAKKDDKAKPADDRIGSSTKISLTVQKHTTLLPFLYTQEAQLPQRDRATHCWQISPMFHELWEL